MASCQNSLERHTPAVLHSLQPQCPRQPWVRVEEPPAGSSIRTNDGKRIWFPVTVRDCTGTLTLYIQEPAALKLNGFDGADHFEAAFVAGKVWFPQMASVKSSDNSRPRPLHSRETSNRRSKSTFASWTQPART